MSKGSSTTRVADLVSEGIGHGDGDLAALERILVDPFRNIGRAVAVGRKNWPSMKKCTGPTSRPSAGWICATMRMLPDVPLRPSGEVMRTAGGVGLMQPRRRRGRDADTATKPACSDDGERGQKNSIQIRRKRLIRRGRSRSSCCTPLPADRR